LTGSPIAPIRPFLLHRHPIAHFCFTAHFRKHWSIPQAYEAAGGGTAAPGLKIFRANFAFRASASCSKLLNDKKIFQSSKNFQGKLYFQDKRKLLKIPE